MAKDHAFDFKNGMRSAMKAWGSPTHVCTECGSQVRPKSITPGSMITELFCWLLFLLPGLIYSLWRIASRYKGCPVCGSKSVIPLGSPTARMILERQHVAQ